MDDEMQGERVHPDEGADFLYELSKKPGAYGTADGECWFATTPNGLLGNLGNHTVTEHQDGTISVTPSILVSGGMQTWHGYLTRGVWKEC